MRAGAAAIAIVALGVGAAATAAAVVADQITHEYQAIENHWNTSYRGHGLGAATAISPDGNLLVVGDTVALGWGAAYVFERADEGWVFRQRLSIARGDGFTQYGFAVAASNDTIVVGAPGQAEDAGNTGYAHVYTRTAGAWTLQQRLQPSYANPLQLDKFGYSVAIEGDRILVGALNGPADEGAASAFERSAGAWNEVQFPVPPDIAYGSEFGFTVEVDGDRAAVAAIGTGTVYTYVHAESGWVLEQQLTPDGPERWEGFGWALSLHGDRLLASAPFLNGVGTLLIYERPTGTWVHTQSLPGPGAYGMFGSALAQTDDRIVVGNAKANVSGGSAHVFAATVDGGWTLATTIAPVDVADADYFGWSLAAAAGQLAITSYGDDIGDWFNVGSVHTYEGLDPPSARQVLTVDDGAPGAALGRGVAIEGDVMVAGVPGLDHDGLTGAGAVYIYERGPEGWTLDQELFGECADGKFGSKVAMDAGTLAVVGACQAQRVYIFEREGDFWTQQALLEFAEPFDSTYSIALQGDTLLLGQPDERIGGVATGGAVRLFTRSGGVWQATATLHASDAYDNDAFGSAVAISGNRILVGAPDNTIDYNQYQGAAYLFVAEGAGWVEQQRLVASDGTGNYDHFGSSVAFAGDQLVVGAVGNVDLTGAVYVFDVTDGGVVQAQKLRAPDANTNEGFGHRVVADGDVMVVATPLKQVFQGCGDLFAKGPEGWVFRARLVASDGGFNDQLTTAMAIDGERMVLAAPFAPGLNGAAAGKVYVFEGIPPAVVIPDPEPTPDPPPAGNTGGGAISPLLLALLLVGRLSATACARARSKTWRS